MLSKKTLLEILDHEAIVQEAYKDSVGVWTWGVGVTNASGHRVYPRYKDNPQTIKRCLEVYEWLLRTKYLPDVVEAFGKKRFDCLTENQVAAALSFHYNTGAIKRASWVKSFKAGNISKAYNEFLNWRKPKSIIPRREKERDLFFDNRWYHTGFVPVYEVKKPSYTPDWGSVTIIDIRNMVDEVLAQAG